MLTNSGKNHVPKEELPEIHERLRLGVHVFASVINEVCPDNREKSLAMTRLEEAVMWANASIERYHKE